MVPNTVVQVVICAVVRKIKREEGEDDLGVLGVCGWEWMQF